MMRENIKMAFASLRSAKMRSFLTMLGIIIGIASVVAINSIGEGVKKSVSDQIGNLGTNLLTITSGKTISKDGQKTSFNASAAIGTTTLTEKDLATAKTTDHVIHTAPIDIISGVAANGTTQASGALIIATTADYQTIRNQKLESGIFFTNAQANDAIVVLGSDAKTSLFGDTDAIGKEITIRSTPLKVVGVLKSTDTGNSFGGPSFDNAIYLPLGPAKTITDGNVQIYRIITQIDEAGNVNPTQTALNEAILKNHGGQEDFSVLTQADLVSTIGSILDLLATFISAIAAIALLVGGIGIMNIMLVSVTERTREIGIRKAIGATRRLILTQFLIEAVILSLIGGLLGVAGAYGLATAIGKYAKITPVFTMNAILIATGVSVAIGIIFGLAPAIKASRKRPIEALRYE